MGQRIIIAGGRDFIPTKEAARWLMDILEKLRPEYIITGDCRGADKWGCAVADSMLIPHKHFPVDWNNGRKAGPLRNEEMAKDGTMCVLFPGGKGTADMKRRAEKHGLIILEWPQPLLVEGEERWK